MIVTPWRDWNNRMIENELSHNVEVFKLFKKRFRNSNLKI